MYSQQKQTKLAISITYSLIAFDERVTHLVTALCMCVCCIIWGRLAYYHYAIAHAHNAAMHKTVTGHVDAKKLLSRRRQSEYSLQNLFSEPTKEVKDGIIP